MAKRRNYTKTKVPFKWPVVASVPGEQSATYSLRSGEIRNWREDQAVGPSAVAGATKKIVQFNNENAARKIKNIVGEDGMGRKKDLSKEQVEKDMCEEADTKDNTSTMGSIGIAVAAEVESALESTALKFNGGIITENSVPLVTDFVVTNDSQLAVKQNSDCTAEFVLSASGRDAVAGGNFDNETSCNSSDYGRADVNVSGAEDNSSVTQAIAIVELTKHRKNDAPCGKRSISADEAYGSGCVEQTRQEIEDSVEKSGKQMAVPSAHERRSGLQETHSESLPVESFSLTDLSCRAAGFLENETVGLGTRHPSLTESMSGTNGEEYEVSLVTKATVESTQGAQDTSTQHISKLRPSHSPTLTFSQRELENNCTAFCTLDSSSNCESYVANCPCRPLNTDGEIVHELSMVVGSGSKKKQKENRGKRSQEISEVKRRNALGRYRRLYCEEHRIRLYGCKMFVALRADLTQSELTAIPLWRICRLQKLLRKYEPVEIDGRDCHFATNEFLRISDDDDLFIITYQPVLFDMLFDTREGAVGLVYDVPGSTPLLGYFPLGEFEMISDFQPFLRRIIALALGRKSFILGEDCDIGAIETFVDRGIKGLCRSECFLEVFPCDLMTAMEKCRTLKKLKNCKQQSFCTSCCRLQRVSPATFSVELGRSPNESDLTELRQPRVYHDVAWVFCSSCVKQLEAIHKLMLFKFRLFCAFRVELTNLYSKLKKGQKYLPAELAKFLEGDSIHNKVLFYEFLTAYYGARDTELKIKARMKDIRNDPNMAVIPLLPVTEAEPSVASLRKDGETKSVDAQKYAGTSMSVAGCGRLGAASPNRSKTISSGKTKKLLSASSDQNTCSESAKAKTRVVLKTKNSNNDPEKNADLAPSNSLYRRNVEVGRKSIVSEVQCNQVSNANAFGGTAGKPSRGARPKSSTQHSKNNVAVESQISTTKCSGSTAFGSQGVCSRNRVGPALEQASRECSSKDGTEIVPVTINIRKSARIPKKKEVFSPAKTNEKASKKAMVAKTLFPLSFEENSAQKGREYEVERFNVATDTGGGDLSAELNLPFAKNGKHLRKVLSTFADENKYVTQRRGKISKRKNRRSSLIVKIPLDMLQSATKVDQEHFPLDMLQSATKVDQEHFVLRREANKKVYERKSKTSVSHT